MASPIYIWFTKEVFYWRSLAATLWSVLCLPIFIFLMSLIINTSLTHPAIWISDAVTGIISTKFLLTMLTFVVATVTVTWFSLPYLSVKPDICSSKIAYVFGLFRWSRLPLLVICLLNGALCSWSIANMIGLHFTDFVSTAEYERTVLNEQCLFVVGCGIFTGIWYYSQYFIKQHYYLRFPSVQRQRVFQVRSELKLVAEKIVWQTLHILKYYYIIYFLFGSVPRIWVCTSFGISEDSQASPLDSIIGLMSFSLLWKTYVTSFVFTFTLSFTLVLIKIFHTERLEFPVTSVMEDSNERMLPDALSCSYSPLLRHLAFFDLLSLGKYASPRLQELLSLSQPGGHPKVWMAVSNSAISTINELTNVVKEENWSIMSKVPINQHRNGMASGNGHYASVYSGDYADSLLTYRGSSNPNNSVLSDNAPIERDNSGKASFKSQLMSKLSSMPILSQFLAQSQDSNSSRLFASCQMQIWAVESLSHIAMRAYTEDRYGIVQNSLPMIFIALLELHESMEKYFKLTTSVKRTNGSFNSFTDGVIRYKLHSVLKASLYRMVNTYKAHLEEIKLKPDEIKKLMPFIQYSV